MLNGCFFRIWAKARVEVASMCPRLKPGVNEERKLGQVGSKCLMCFGIGAKAPVKEGDVPQAEAWGFYGENARCSPG